MTFALQQIEGRQKCQYKLPTFYANQLLLYPVRLSVEQCSSEQTAKYKQKIASLTCECKTSFADLTAGFGIDTFWLSEIFDKAYYVEQNAELCKIAQHNYDAFGRKNIIVGNHTAEEYLQSAIHHDLIFIDPARRNKAGKKVVKLEDCQPNLLNLWPEIQSKSTYQMVKLSPMIDLKEISKQLNPQQIHVVSINNECKEIIAVCRTEKTLEPTTTYCVNIQGEKMDVLFFTAEQEYTCEITYATKLKKYIYEPNASIMKGGAYRLIAHRYNLEKLSANTHLYTSNELVSDFPGRIWKVDGQYDKRDNLKQANVITRNYPLSAEQLKKKLKIKDGGDSYIIGTTLGKKAIVVKGVSKVKNER